LAGLTDIGMVGSMTESRHVMFSGYAKPPVDTCVTNKPLGIVVLIDTFSDEIVAADCTLVTEVARKFIADLLQGQSLKDGPTQIIEELVYRFQDVHCKTVIAAIRLINDKYIVYKKRNDVSPLIFPV
jgi:hypothetical protein